MSEPLCAVCGRPEDASESDSIVAEPLDITAVSRVIDWAMERFGL